MPEQLPLMRGNGVPVSPRFVRSHARRHLAAFRSLRVGFDLLAYLTDVALLEELRRRYRAAIRDARRAARQSGATLRAGRAAAVLAASPEGRRVHRAIQEVSERVQSSERALCV